MGVCAAGDYSTLSSLLLLLPGTRALFLQPTILYFYIYVLLLMKSLSNLSPHSPVVLMMMMLID